MKSFREAYQEQGRVSAANFREEVRLDCDYQGFYWLFLVSTSISKGLLGIYKGDVGAQDPRSLGEVVDLPEQPHY